MMFFLIHTFKRVFWQVLIAANICHIYLFKKYKYFNILSLDLFSMKWIADSVSVDDCLVFLNLKVSSEIGE